MSLPVAAVDLHIIVIVFSRCKRKAKRWQSLKACAIKKSIVFHLITSLVEWPLNIHMLFVILSSYDKINLENFCIINTTLKYLLEKYPHVPLKKEQAGILWNDIC